MNTKSAGITLTIAGVVALVGAYYLGWINIPESQASKDRTNQTMKMIETAKSELRKEMQTQDKVNSLQTEVNSLKAQLAQRETAATEPDPATVLVQDKLSEVQDQINDLTAKIDKMGSCCATDTSCMDNCMAGCKEKCANKPVVKKKVVKKLIVKKTPCRETIGYLTCVKDNEAAWDAHCSKAQNEIIQTKIVEKNQTKGNVRKEMQAAIIKVDKEPRHAMCLTPRDFYKTQCERISCGINP